MSSWKKSKREVILLAGTRKIPLRKCVGCGEMKPKKELMRVLKTEEGGFVLNLRGKKNGRGAYL